MIRTIREKLRFQAQRVTRCLRNPLFKRICSVHTVCRIQLYARLIGIDLHYTARGGIIYFCNLCQRTVVVQYKIVVVPVAAPKLRTVLINVPANRLCLAEDVYKRQPRGPANS